MSEAGCSVVFVDASHAERHIDGDDGTLMPLDEEHRKAVRERVLDDSIGESRRGRSTGFRLRALDPKKQPDHDASNYSEEHGVCHMNKSINS